MPVLDVLFANEQLTGLTGPTFFRQDTTENYLDGDTTDFPFGVGAIGIENTASGEMPVYTFASGQTAVGVTWYSLEVGTSLSDVSPLMRFLGASNEFLFQLVSNASGNNLILQAWDGSAWTDLCATASGENFRNFTYFSFFVEMGNSPSGRATIGIGDVELASFTGDTLLTAVSEIRRVQFGSCMGPTSAVDRIHFNGVIFADEDPRSWRALAYQPSANGALQQWTGGEPEIDSWVGTSDGFISSETSGQISTFAQPALSSFYETGYDVIAGGVVASARKFGGAQSIKLGMRIGSTWYAGPDQPLTDFFDIYTHLWTTNPSTGSPGSAFDTATIDGIQSGVELV